MDRPPFRTVIIYHMKEKQKNRKGEKDRMNGLITKLKQNVISVTKSIPGVRGAAEAYQKK